MELNTYIVNDEKYIKQLKKYLMSANNSKPPKDHEDTNLSKTVSDFISQEKGEILKTILEKC